MLPNPKIQIAIPRIATKIGLLNFSFSSIQAVNGSRRDIEELKAAIEIKMKKIIEKKLPRGSE